MLLNKQGIFIADENLSVFRLGNDIHYVKGFFFLPGFRSGEESCKQVHRVLEETGSIPFEDLYGSFVYCICRQSGEIFFFSSNSEFSCLYVSDLAISNSFLELLEYYKKENKQLHFNMESVCEYYTTGRFFFDKTLVKEIRLLPHDCYIHVKNNSCQVLKKGISPLDAPCRMGSHTEYFAALAHALDGKKVACALTGGYDSRMVFAQLKDKLPLHLYLSSNVDGKESTISKRISDLTGVPLYIIRTEKPKLSEEYLFQMLRNADGAYPFEINGQSRINNFKHNLFDKGFEVNLTGDGGVLHKDWEWMQDLPFYHKKKTDIHKFYHQRLAFIQSNNNLGEKLVSLYNSQEERICNQLKQYCKEINTKSYDCLYYYVNGNRQSIYNNTGSGIISYAPLSELDVVRYSYHLPRRRRFFYNYIREMTTKASPEIARIPTNYGTTSSSEPFYLIRDVFFQFCDYGKKGIRMLGRKYFKKNLLNEQLLDWTLEGDLRRFPLTKHATDWGVGQGYLSDGTTPNQLSYQQICCMIHLYFLAHFYYISP